MGNEWKQIKTDGKTDGVIDGKNLVAGVTWLIIYRKIANSLINKAFGAYWAAAKQAISRQLAGLKQAQ